MINKAILTTGNGEQEIVEIAKLFGRDHRNELHALVVKGHKLHYVKQENLTFHEDEESLQKAFQQAKQSEERENQDVEQSNVE